MYRVHVNLDDATVGHLNALRDALGSEEFTRLYPGLEVWGSEVWMNSETEHGWRTILSGACEAQIPPKSIVRALEELRASNERLGAQNLSLQEQLKQAEGRSARIALIVGSVLGLLGVAATIVAAAFF